MIFYDHMFAFSFVQDGIETIFVAASLGEAKAAFLASTIFQDFFTLDKKIQVSCITENRKNQI